MDFIVFPCQETEDKYTSNPRGGKEILHSQGIPNNELQTETLTRAVSYSGGNIIPSVII